MVDVVKPRPDLAMNIPDYVCGKEKQAVEVYTFSLHCCTWGTTTDHLILKCDNNVGYDLLHCGKESIFILFLSLLFIHYSFFQGKSVSKISDTGRNPG